MAVPEMSLLVLFLLLLSTLICSATAPCSGEHVYVLTFDFNWSFDTDRGFPVENPEEEPGFSRIVCASHSSNYSMWRPGTVLGDSMVQFLRNEEDEDGSVSKLRNELDNAEGDTVKNRNITAEGANSLGELTVHLRVDPSHTLLSCASRIRPSPAWFIGISSLDMCNDTSFREAQDLVIIGWWGGLDEAEDYVENKKIKDSKRYLKVRRRIDFAPYGYGTLFISRQDPNTTVPGDSENEENSPNAARTNGPRIVPAAEPICVDSNALRHLPPSALVFPTHRYAHVLCDPFNSCATSGHIVIYKNQPMMMKTYCELEFSCERRVMLVNSPKYSRAMRVSTATHNLEFTSFAARFATQAEEGLLSLAVHMGL